jgi:hypothetical protein
MRWIVRDVGIFLYGCAFCGQRVWFGLFKRVSAQPAKKDMLKHTSVLFLPQAALQKPTARAY